MKYEIKKEFSESIKDFDNIAPSYDHLYFDMQTMQEDGSDSFMRITLIESYKGSVYVEIEIDGKLHQIDPHAFYGLSNKIQKLLK